MTFLSFLISGISLGSIYAIIALGYTMVYGIAKMLNFAHGDVIMVGAYICFYAVTRFELPAIVGVILAMHRLHCFGHRRSSGWPISRCGQPPSWPCSSPPSA